MLSVGRLEINHCVRLGCANNVLRNKLNPSPPVEVDHARPHVIKIVGCVMSEDVGTLFIGFFYSVEEYHALSIKVGMLLFVRHSLLIFYLKSTM